MYHNPSVAKHETLLHVSRALRQPLLHYAHAALTFTSIALLWVVDSSSELQDTAAVATIVVHATSMAASLVLIPRDASAGLTLLSVGTLAVALGLQYGSHAQLRRFFCLRFVSLLRLGQLCVLFFPRLLRFTRMKRTFFMSSISVLFPVIVTGCVAYVVELLRAQVYLVHYYDPVANNETTAWPLPKRLASNLRRNEQYPNEEDARQLFAYYFKEDAYIYLSLLDYWVLPACCVATALTHLRWTNANLLNSQCLMMDAIRLLEDPMALARFGTRGFFFRRVGHGVLVVGLLFGVLFSPSTHASADDYRFFFSMETFFTLVGLIDGFVRLVLAVHRCGCSWVACACMPKGLLDKELLVGNTVLLLAELLQLLYWSCALPIALTLLVERDMCLISPDDYAVFFVTLRFLLLLRMLPRQYVLSLVLRGEVFIFAGACVVVYFVGAASALADVHVAFWGGGITANLWKLALRDLCRQTFTAASPVTLNNMWTPPNYTQIVHEMVESNESIRVVATDYASSPLLLGLAVIGKVLIASLFGLTIGVFFVPLQSLIFSTMPKRALFLYDALRGGTNAIINAGARLHDDMRPENRKRIQERKFSRMYKTRGIPLWLLPHLLEELGMCKPGQQRRLMFTLEQLFVFLPIAEKRARCVAEYVDEWDLYSSGGPGRLSFSALPVYPAQVKSYNHARDDASSSRYVPPLRLVQAVALFESDFPPHSSVGSKIWLEFFKVAQRVRGATLMQSLWRMYVAVKDFENDAGRNRMDILMAWTLRRAFRRNRTLSRVSFLRYETFKDAVRFQQNIFNPGTGHYDVLDRLRGHFAALQPTRHLHLRNCLTPAPLRPRGTPPATRGNPLRGQEPLEVWCGVSYVPESSTDRDNTDSAGDVLGIQDAIFR
ncbi:hypothetical protein DQ04_01071110 [Trypanosoma grayi]|uniref:hypothetical protein n=1 Tax=Trypanosoma grayi TaxID=71804 RepID=UPI0004F4BB60|nr:hypothetical protein DQ04_01071110 [Trypanosoma grayi]KEG13330.1 hypothetical protein DQ04_01071110 [Trypanosoma grayi]